MSSGCGDVLSLQDLKTAKLHQTFEAEVITGLVGGVSGGASIDYATNPVTNQTQKTLPAILRDLGFRPASFNFTQGGTLAVGDSDVAVLWSIANGGDGDYYIWKGAYPKVIPAASTPASSGGVSSSGWMPLGDISLRTNLVTAGYGYLVDDTNIKVMQPSVGGVIRSQHLKNTDSISVADFGALANNTDCTAAVQAAIDYATTNGFGEVLFPTGTWRIEGALTVTTNITIRGTGVASTQLYYTGVNLILFDVGNGTTNPNNVFIQDLRINVVNTSTSGALIRFRNGYNCGLRNVRIDGFYWNGIQMLGGTQHFIYKLQDLIINGKSSSNNSIILGDATYGTVRDVFLNNIVCGGAVQGAGILHQWSSGVYASNIDVISAKYGVAWIPESGSGGNCVGSFYSQVLADTCQQHGFIANPPTGTRVSEIVMIGCWGSSNGVNNGTPGNYAGLYLNGNNGTVANFNISSFQATNNQGNGVEIVGASVSGITFSGVQCNSNSMVGSAVAHGIYIGPDVRFVTIVGGKCGVNPAFGFNRQAYGVFIASGTGNRLTVVGMDLEGNTTGALINGATGSGVYIAGCSPYRTSNRGSAQLSSGSTSVAVNPGVSGTFTAADVQVTPTTDLAGARWWFTVSGSTITIRTNTAPASNMFFSWSVDIAQTAS